MVGFPCYLLVIRLQFYDYLIFIDDVEKLGVFVKFWLDIWFFTATRYKCIVIRNSDNKFKIQNFNLFVVNIVFLTGSKNETWRSIKNKCSLLHGVSKWFMRWLTKLTKENIPIITFSKTLIFRLYNVLITPRDIIIFSPVNNNA